MEVKVGVAVVHSLLAGYTVRLQVLYYFNILLQVQRRGLTLQLWLIILLLTPGQFPMLHPQLAR